jgi:hypothetical protein
MVAKIFSKLVLIYEKIEREREKKLFEYFCKFFRIYMPDKCERTDLIIKNWIKM